MLKGRKAAETSELYNGLEINVLPAWKWILLNGNN